MKKSNRLVAILLSVIMLCGILPLNTFTVNVIATSLNFKYTIDDGCVTITDCFSSGKEIVIPSEIEYYPVTAIGYEAFKNCSSHESIILPDSITSIGNGAFMYCGSLTNITIPDGVINIGDYTFHGCGSLVSVTLPSSITNIGLSTFSGCDSLENLVIPENVINIGFQAFNYCDSLTNIAIPDNVTDIGNYAFWNCGSLKSVYISNSVSNIGLGAFLNCCSVTDVYYYGTEEEWNNISIEDNNDNLTSATIHFLNEHSHTFSNWQIRINATCTANGEEYRICSSCGEEETRIISATGHTYNSVITSPTCTEQGYTTYTCENCDDIYIGDYTEALGHSFGNWITKANATCTANGEEYRTCSSCGEEETRTVSATEHTYNSVITSPTCTEQGYTTYTCENCKDTYLDNYIGALGHSFEDWKIRTDATCTVSGEEYRTCLSCGEEETQTVTTTEHIYDSACDATCNICGKTRTIEHLYDESGIVCNVCGYVRFFSYTISNNAVTITDCDTSISGDVVIPSTLEGYPVTSIGEYAFEDCASLTSITIPDSITSIGDSAFDNCTSLTKVNITNLAAWCNIDFEYNSSNPLYYAKNLYINGILETDIFIPDTVTEIKDSAFYNCSSLTSVVIPNSVTRIGDNAFFDCDSLPLITIPDSVTSIGYSAFMYCTLLKSITIPDSVTSIGNNAFYGTAYYNNSSNWKNKILYIGHHLIEAESSLSGSYTIKSGTKTIADYAFSYCTSLTSITIPNSVTSISGCAFYGCDSLTSITIPNSVTSIGDCAFYDCDSLTSITIPNSVTSIGDCAFYDCDSLTSITIPSSVTSIGDMAFSNCTSLTSVSIPNSVTSISKYVFSNCDSLQSIKIGNGVNGIGDNAFDDCDSLKSITIPDSVISIGVSAFYSCSSLQSVTIGKGVTSIGRGAFDGCSCLSKVNITDLGAWCNIDFKNSYSNPLRYANNLYIKGNLATDIVIPDSVTEIKSCAFLNCSSLISVIIPNSVISIDGSAFYNCDSLQSVAIGKGVTSIGYSAFYYCKDLSTVYYCGTKEEWDNIEIGLYNEYFTSANRYYHNYGDWQIRVEPTCSKEGERYRICSICSKEETKVISTNERHTYSAVIIPPSCAERGYTIHTCSTCGDTYTDNYTDATGIHIYENGNCKYCNAYLESAHDYATGFDETWDIYRKGAISITLTFSAETFVEEDWDFIYIYDGNGNEIGKYTGDELASQTVTVSGDTAKIRLYSDRINTAYGFKLTDITAEYNTGDLNGDGETNILDFIRLKKILAGNAESDASSPDLDNSGDTDTGDMIIFKKFLLGIIADLKSLTV